MQDKDDPSHSAHIGVLAVALLVLGLIWLFWLNNGALIVHNVMVGTLPKGSVTDSTSTLGQLGQVGDAFGAINALFAAIAGAFVAWAGYLQNRALKQARAAYDEERKSRQKQEFESTFFKMLELARGLAERVEDINISERLGVIRTAPKAAGPAALDARAAAVAGYVGNAYSDDPERQASSLAICYSEFVYKKQPSALGPYFRLLYQLFQVIAESELDQGTQRRYANIARGQISEGAVLLLALNGLTRLGHKFIPLIERFGLLEHMHQRYRRQYEKALRMGYRERAFLGSVERSTHPIEPTPLHEPGFFEDRVEMVRRVHSMLGG